MSMFKSALLAVALVGGIALSAPVAAQERVVVRHTSTVHTVDRGPRWNNHRRVCTTKWRNHRRVRVCSRR